MPKVHVVRKHDVDVFIVLARKHGIQAIDFAVEHGHAFVFCGRTIQSDKPKAEEVRSLHQFGQNHLAIECREGGVVDVGAIIFLEADEPGVFDTVALRWRGWEKNPFRQLLLGLKLNLIVGPGQSQHPSDRVPVRHARLIHFHFETGAQFFTNNKPSEGSIDTPPQFPPPSVLGKNRALPSSGSGVYGSPIFIRFASNNSLQNRACSGDRSYMSSRRKVFFASGGGFTGNGCVFEVTSPGTDVWGTGRSSIPYTGSPVTRSNTNNKAILVISATAGMTRPPRRISNSAGGAARS